LSTVHPPSNAGNSVLRSAAKTPILLRFVNSLVNSFNGGGLEPLRPKKIGVPQKFFAWGEALENKGFQRAI
jgi:hypothetical protein